MTRGTFILLMTTVCAISSAGGYQVGKAQELRQIKPVIVENGGAYYDMQSGDFTWGPRPMMLAMPNLPPQDMAAIKKRLEDVLQKATAARN